MSIYKKIALIAALSLPLALGFGIGTVKKIDEIQNNTGSNILLNPTSKVELGYGSGSFALQTSASNEIEESTVTSTELGYLSGVTSGIQGQIDALGTIDLTSDVTGILPIANGGTGSATQNFVDLTTDQSIAGVKSFGSELVWAHIVTPSNPSSGFVKVYAKNNDKIYKLDSSGNETEIGSGGGGGSSVRDIYTHGSSYSVSSLTTTAYTIDLTASTSDIIDLNWARTNAGDFEFQASNTTLGSESNATSSCILRYTITLPNLSTQDIDTECRVIGRSTSSGNMITSCSLPKLTYIPPQNGAYNIVVKLDPTASSSGGVCLLPAATFIGIVW